MLSLVIHHQKILPTLRIQALGFVAIALSPQSFTKRTLREFYRLAPRLNSTAMSIGSINFLMLATLSQQ